jgi:polyisoprenoid-binding protein YceI
MKKFALSLLLFGFAIGINAQKFISRSGFIKFYSYTPVEEIEANTNQAASILDISSGTVQVSLLVRSFSFKKELMQEHFNENYMESDKYPKSSFKGTITNIEALNLEKDGEYEVDVEGDITIHNVTKPLKTKATIEIKNGLPKATTTFKVLTEDFDIEIPDLVKDKIAKEIEITVDITYQAP